MNRIKLSFIKLFVSTFLMGGLMIIQAQAAPGDLDTTFGNGGVVQRTLEYGGGPFPNRIRIQPDGKIVTLVAYPYDDYSLILRHNADGTVDTAFGSGGYVFLDYDNGLNSLYDFVIQPDGKLLAVGVKNVTLALFRFNPNGQRDTGFGTNGVITTPINYGNFSSGNGIALQPDGKIVVTGYAANSNVEIGRLVLIRYLPDGTPDTTFGTNGIVVEAGLNFGGEILIQPDGKIIVTGSVSNTILIARYNSNGTPDNSFGTNGKVNPGIYYGIKIALQTDGRIVINGRVNDTVSVIKRYTINGTPDTSFGTDGTVSIIEPNPNPNSSGIAQSLTIQKNGKILTAGQRNFNFAISRYNSNGTIDTAFGLNGLVITPFGNLESFIQTISLQPDGKIIAAGLSNYGTVALARYLGDPVTTNFDYDGDRRADLAVFRPSNATWYLNRSQTGITSTRFGLATDKPVPADYDGDGKTDLAVYRDGTWYWLNSSNGVFNQIQFGLTTDIPVPADFTGDGRADLAVFRNGIWWMRNSANNQITVSQFGLATDKPVVADYDGDGKADQAVYRGNGEWHLNRSTLGYTVIQYGIATDKPVPADYDGDGKTDVAVFRPSTGNWYVLNSATNSVQIQNWGLATDALVPADYDGDGKADIAVYRGGIWYIRQTTGGINYANFGLSGDVPTNQVQ